MKRFLISLLASFALPTAVNANLIDEYNQQKLEKNKCTYYAKNIEWKSQYNTYHYHIDNNKIIYVTSYGLPYLNPDSARCKQIGILNQEYRRKEPGWSDYYYVTTFSRFENGNLVIYEKRQGYKVEKEIYYRFRGKEESLGNNNNNSKVNSSRPDYLKLMDRYTYGDHKRTPLPEYKNKWWNW